MTPAEDRPTAPDWDEVRARVVPGTALAPLVGTAPLVVTGTDGEGITVRSRLWWARLTRPDYEAAVRVLGAAPPGLGAVALSERIRAHVAEGTGDAAPVTGCSRTPNLAAVLLRHLGAVPAGPVLSDPGASARPR